MKKIALTIFGFLWLTSQSYSQYSFLGADAYGSGNSWVAVPSFSSIYHNPGGIGSIKNSFVSTHFLRTLPVEGLSTIGISGVFVNKLFNAGLYADSFGDQFYRESRFGLAISKKIDKVSIGLKGSYYGVNIDEMSNRSIFLGEAGMMVAPSEFFSLGLHILNFTGGSLYEKNGLPTQISFGAAIYPNKKLSISSQFDYIPGRKTVFRMGLHYQMRDEIGFSSGINPEMKSVHFGLNFLLKQYGFYYAVASHPNVGLAHQLSLIYQFNE